MLKNKIKTLLTYILNRCKTRWPSVSDARLKRLTKQVRSGDPDNIEAQAAQRYWPLLMGKNFRRNRNLESANSFLNYGYMILRSAVARSILAAGLHPSLSIHHQSRGYMRRQSNEHRTSQVARSEKSTSGRALSNCPAMADYFLSDDAALDLQYIYRQGLDRIVQVQADKYLDELFNLFDLLARNPEVDTSFDVQGAAFRRHPHKAHVLVFEPAQRKSGCEDFADISWVNRLFSSALVLFNFVGRSPPQ